jgi:predicted anti-sigma-YlaC factor YlaD
VSRYLDGDLTPAARSALEQHLRGCPTCREEVAVLRRMDRVVSAWGARRRPFPARTDARIAASIERRHRLRPILALGRMMPAAVGTFVAAVLVLMSANMGRLYQNGPGVTPMGYSGHVQRIIESQSKPLQNARRSTAILGQRPAPQGQAVGQHRTQLALE